VWFRPSDKYLVRLPNFLTNLQACFDVLELVCEQRGIFYQIHQTQQRRFVVCICDHYDEVGDCNKVGETKNEAIILAVLATEGSQP